MFRLHILIVLAVLSATLAFAQGASSYAIYGKVISGSGKPVIGGSILLDKVTGTTCDTAGRFSFSHLARGNYKLSFRSADYERKDTVVTITGSPIDSLMLIVRTSCESFNRARALRDIRKGRPLLFVDDIPATSTLSSDKAFERSYGVSFFYRHASAPPEECMTRYNEAVFEYLDRKSGGAWRQQIRKNVVGLN